MTDIIIAEGLTRSFGSTTALAGVDLSVPEGSVLGLLGPNGAGKTTIVRILATLLAADGGRAVVAGHDVTRSPHAVRSLIGLAGQYAAVDENLTGAENLAMIAWLLGFDRRAGRARASDLLERFDLTDAARKPAKTYSGGMRRRLDLAASLVGRPLILMLDEPTTGLDPRSRLALWDVIRDLVADGTTALLTTQYLEEADALADSIVVIDHGRVVARGSADELKSRTGGSSLLVRPAHPGDVPRAMQALAGFHAVAADGGRAVEVPVGEDSAVMAAAVRAVDDAGIGLSDLSLQRPSLDDVFLALTGSGADPAAV